MRHSVFREELNIDRFSALAIESFGISPLMNRTSSLSNTDVSFHHSRNYLSSTKPVVIWYNSNDDYAADVTTIGLLNPGESTTGSIDFLGDRDWFAIKVEEGDGIVFTHSTEGFDQDGFPNQLHLKVYDHDGSFLGSVGGGYGLTFDASGTFFVQASGPAGAFGYSYSITASQPIADDFSSSVLTIGSIEMGGSVSGRFDFRGDKDWFRFSATAGDIIEFSEGNSNFINIYDSTGERLETRFSGDGYLFEATGEYFIEVGSDSVGDYTLTASFPIEDDYANNDSTNITVALGTTISGTIEHSGDLDWFRMTANAGDTFELTFSGNPHVNLFTEDGIYMGSVHTPHKALQFDSDLVFYIVVQGLSKSEYTITASDLIVDDYRGDVETDGVLSLNGSVSGRADFAYDQDWFMFTIDANDIVRFETNDDVVLWLYNDGGDLVQDLSISDIYAFDEGGTYYLSVERAHPTQKFSYTVGATILDDDHGHNIGSATLLTPDTPITGKIDYQSDTDWFAIEVEANDAVVFSFEGIRDARIWSDAYDTIESQVKNNSIVVFDEAGTFYLQISERLDTEYSVSISTPLSDDYAGDRSTMATLLPGESIKLRSDYSRDRDAFAVQVEAGHRYSFELSTSEVGMGIFDETYSRHTSAEGVLTIDFFAHYDKTIYVGTIGGRDFVDETYTVSSSVVAIADLPIDNFGDRAQIFDPNSGTLFIAANHGTVLRFDTKTQLFLESVYLGGSLTGLAISEDGSTLYVGDNDTQDDQARLHRLDTDTLTVTTHVFQAEGVGYQIYDIALGASSDLYTTWQYPGSGWTDIGVFDTDNLADGPQFGTRVRQDSIIESSEDGRYLLFAEVYWRSNPSFVLDTITGETIGQGRVESSNGNALSSSLGMIASKGTASVNFKDFQFNLLGTFDADGESIHDVKFSQNGQAVYLLVGWNNQSLVVVDPTSFEEVRRYELDSNFSTFETDLNGRAYLFDRYPFETGTAAFPFGSIENFGTTRLSGTSDNDVLSGSTQEDWIFGGDGNDTLYGLAGLDRLQGEAGDDIIYGGEDSDHLIGGVGADQLFGESGNDQLNGGTNNDTLNGGLGNDDLYGGSGSDTFIFELGGGVDVIHDFEAGVDHLMLGISPYMIEQSFMEMALEGDGFVELYLGNGDLIRLMNITIDDLDIEDFTFGLGHEDGMGPFRNSDGVFRDDGRPSKTSETSSAKPQDSKVQADVDYRAPFTSDLNGLEDAPALERLSWRHDFETSSDIHLGQWDDMLEIEAWLV